MRDFLRRVGLPSIIDATPATLRPPVHMTPAARLLLLVGRPLWAWRVELATVLLAVAILRWLADQLGVALAVLLVGVLALALGAGTGGAPLGPAAVPQGACAPPVDAGRPSCRAGQLQRPGAPGRRPPPDVGR